MATLRYNLPSDNIITNATLSLATGNALAAFPLANVYNLNPALPAKFAEQSIRIVCDFGSATAVHLVALIHHNLDPALEVRWQANATNSWGSPSFNQAFTLGALDTDGYRPNAYLDFSGAPPTYRYHSLVVVGTNTAAVIIPEIWIGSAVRTLTHNYRWPIDRMDVRPGRQQWTTRAGVEWTYPAAGRQRELVASVKTTDVGIAALSAWSQACGGTEQPTLIIPDAPDISDAVLAKWTEDFKYQAPQGYLYERPVGWREIARGLPWP